MFGLGREQLARRKRVRQLRADASLSAWEKFTRHVGLWPTILALLFWVLALGIGAYGRRALPYSVGQKIGQPIVARVDFSFADPKQTDANRKTAREATPNYYRVNTEAIDRITSELTRMFEAAQADTPEAYRQLAGNAKWAEDATVYEYLHAAGETPKAEYTRSLEQLRLALHKERTARPTTAEDRDPPSKAVHVIVQPPAAEPKSGEEPPRPVEVPTLELIQTGNRAALDGRAEVLAAYFAPPLRASVREVLARVMLDQPLLVYDQKRTLDAMVAAEQAVPPAVKHYEQGKPFVFPRLDEAKAGGTGEELGLTRTDLDLLDTETAAYQQFLDGGTPEAVKLKKVELYERVGQAVVLAFLTVALFLYLGLYQPRVLRVQPRTLVFVGLILATLAATRLIGTRLPYPELTLLPVLLAASVLTLAYPQRFAYGVMVFVAIMVCLLIRGDLRLLITLCVGGFVNTLLLRDIRTRTKIITTGVWASLAVFTVVGAFGLIDGQETGYILPRASLAAGSTILAALVLQGVLPFVERTFKIATSLTLLEWRDANKPLLQRLVREAPGTYQHSLVLGTMAEAACEAIGANGLLAHVGALYHDIGKVSKAEYFAENQEAAINRHDSLAPTMSMLIILGHVKDGIATAREYGLPRVLIPFIAEHHGTTLVRYFHHMASEKQPKIASGKHDREVSEAEFRYPGPKPQSKETAVLMLCDGTEGAVRAIPEPTPGRIETAVHQILQARLKDGQFDECDITLRELHLVEESLVKSLCRFHHGRVAYPKDSKDSPRRSEPAPENGAPPEPRHAVG